MALTSFPRVIAALAAGALRSIAGAIRRGLGGLGLFNWIRQKFAPLTSTETSQLYQLSAQYVSAGAQQSGLGPAGRVNPGNVPHLLPGAGPNFQPGSIVYDIRVNTIDPATGRGHWVTVYVESSAWLTNDQIAAEASFAAGQALNNYEIRGPWLPPVGYSPGGIIVVGIATY